LDPKLPTASRITSFQKRVGLWAATNLRAFPWRAREATSFQAIVSEVLLQRTQAQVVANFLPVFLTSFPSWRALATAPEEEIQEKIRKIGIWRKRAQALKGLAVEVCRRRGRFPANREELESIPAVGQYVANAVLLFYHRQPQPLLDAGMARVLERHFGPRRLSDIRHDPYLQELSRRVVVTDDPSQMNWAILDLAALICKVKQPRCGECPVKRSCRYRRELIR
jgi:A/G-specific adenine glycosylase